MKRCPVQSIHELGCAAFDFSWRLKVDGDVVAVACMPRALARNGAARTCDDAPSGVGKPLYRSMADTAAGTGQHHCFLRRTHGLNLVDLSQAAKRHCCLQMREVLPGKFMAWRGEKAFGRDGFKNPAAVDKQDIFADPL